MLFPHCGVAIRASNILTHLLILLVVWIQYWLTHRRQGYGDRVLFCLEICDQWSFTVGISVGTAVVCDVYINDLDTSVHELV